MKSIEEEYPDYDWEMEYEPLRDACHILQFIGIISPIVAIVAAFFLITPFSPVFAGLYFVGGVIWGLMTYAVAGGIVVLCDIAQDVNYSVIIAMITEKKARKGP